MGFDDVNPARIPTTDPTLVAEDAPSAGSRDEIAVLAPQLLDAAA